MKKISLWVMAIMAMVMLSACGSTATDSAGDNYNVAVNNTGDGDVTVNTGSGTVIFTEDECIFVQDENTTRPCTQDEMQIAQNDIVYILDI